MQESGSSQRMVSTRNAEAQRLAFFLRVALPALGPVLLAIMVVAAVAFAWVRATQ